MPLPSNHCPSPWPTLHQGRGQWAQGVPPSTLPCSPGPASPGPLLCRPSCAHFLLMLCKHKEKPQKNMLLNQTLSSSRAHQTKYTGQRCLGYGLESPLPHMGNPDFPVADTGVSPEPLHRYFFWVRPRALAVQAMPGTEVWNLKQNCRSGLLPVGTFSHTEQDFRGQVKPVPVAGASSPPKIWSMSQANPRSAGETHETRSAQPVTFTEGPNTFVST